MLRIASFDKESFVNGPGVRYTIFTQGCKHNCKGCHNPSTHSFAGGKDYSVSDIYEDILTHENIDGVTLSGGDPMYQAESCLVLAKKIKDNTQLDIWCYTGFTFEQLLSSDNEYVHKLLNYVDVLVDGRFDINTRSLELVFKGSENQRIIDVQQSLKENKVIEWEEQEEY